MGTPLHVATRDLLAEANISHVAVLSGCDGCTRHGGRACSRRLWFLLPACVVLTWEGGLFFVPSVVALIVASIPGRRSAPA